MCLERGGEAGDVPVEIVDHLHPDRVGSVAKRLDIRERRPGVEAVCPQAVRRGVDRRLSVRVAELAARDLAEARRRLGEVSH